MNASVKEIASLIHLNPASNIPNPGLTVNMLLIDSRSLSIPEHTLFFAIPTKGNDGHRYMRELYDKGVRAFVCNYQPVDMQDATDADFLIVDDTTVALQQIGAHRRSEYHGRLLSITGSRGKTTLKEWIFQLLEPLENIVRSPRSYNSQIGVPLSLCELQSDTTLAIIEAGVSRPGEMKKLADCIRPDTVIITNISNEHDDGFKDREEKCREKLLLASTPETNLLIYPYNDPIISNCIRRMDLPDQISCSGWSVSDPEADLFIRITPNRNKSGNRHSHSYEYHFSPTNLHGSISAPGSSDADISNTASALAFMLSLGLPTDVIAARFEKLYPIDVRTDVVEGINDSLIIYDSFTSDLSSLPSAIDIMNRRTPPGMPKTVILSDPLHESRNGKRIWEDIADILKRNDVKRFIGIGPELKKNIDIISSLSQYVIESYENTDDFLIHRSPSDFSGEMILLKGAPEFEFPKILEMLEARKHETVLEVNLDAIKKNFNYFRELLPETTGLVAMVKASAYGAGSYEVAKTMQDCGAAYLAVAVLDEGIELRKRGITMPIMVMNPKVVNYKSMFAYNLEPEIYNCEMLMDVIKEAAKNDIHKYPVHLKLDTGMHRMGFIGDELEWVMNTVSSQDNIEVRTVFSHLATADCPDMDDYTYRQLECFRKYTDYIQSRSKHKILRHILNSAGIVRFPEYHYELTRLGIGLYGVNTLPPDIEKPLEVVSTLRTMIISIREWKAGETIGYGRKGVLKRDSRIATIPIGYADGMNRHFGNGRISVKVNGKDAPTIGNICMDACMIDITGIACNPGDTVEIFGKQAGVDRLAEVLDTIPYEILTSVSPRVKRVYYRE